MRERFGEVSRMWLWRYMRDPGVSQPVQFGGLRSVRRRDLGVRARQAPGRGVMTRCRSVANPTELEKR